MAIHFNVKTIKSVLTKEGTRAPRCVASNKSLGQIKLYDLADDISNRCSLHPSDVVAMMEAMSDVIIHYLSLGHSVEFGRLGCMHTTIGSRSTETAEEFDTQHITTVRVRYTPSTKVKSAMSKVQFVRIGAGSSSKANKPGTALPTPAPTPGSNPDDGE